MPWWKFIQNVSFCAPSGLYMNWCWYAFMNFYPECELLCIFWALYKLLICLDEILSRMWVSGSCTVPGLYMNWHWHAFTMKFYSGCELLCAVWALYESLTCLYKILSRGWVAVCLLGYTWIIDMPLKNSFQYVSCCVPSKLYLDHWYASMKSYPACELLFAF